MWIRYTILLIIRFIVTVLSWVLFPILYPFRHWIMNFIKRNVTENVDKLFDVSCSKFRLHIDIRFYAWLLFCGSNPDSLEGGEWYRKEQKSKWYSNDNFLWLKHFWISYCWTARNAAWNFYEFYLREGKCIGNVNVVREEVYEAVSDREMPHMNFKDKDGNDSNNKGKYIRYRWEVDNNKWTATLEGVKVIEFSTSKRNTRRFYTKVKIMPLYLIGIFFCIEYEFGWNWYDGLHIFHFKHIFKKMDDLSLSDYNKYKSLL